MNRSGSTLLPLLVFLAVTLAYAPSFDGAWIGADQTLYAGATIAHLGDLVRTFHWTPPGEAAFDLYHPLTTLSFVPLQTLFPGPLGERLLNIVLHLVAVALVANLGQTVIDGADGVPRSEGPGAAAWFGAALFGLHPGVTEAVASPGARVELLPMLLTLAGWRALLSRNDRLAGALIALTPFCDETFLIVPVTALTWMWATGRLARPTLLMGWAGSGLYILARRGLGLGPPPWGSPADVPGELGALAVRLVHLVGDPTAPNALVPYVANPVAGTVLLVAGLAGFVLARRRPIVAALVAPLVLLLPWAPAVARLGIVPDRAFYPVFAGIGIAAAAGLARLGTRPAVQVAWLVPLALGYATALRTPDWLDDGHVYGASLKADPANDRAAYKVARYLHTRMSNCHAAVPLYRQALSVEPLALAPLETCLMLGEEYPEAAQLAVADYTKGGREPTVLRAGARALLEMHRGAEALPLAEALVEAQPEVADNKVLLGDARAAAGQDGAAQDAWREAIGLPPKAP